MGFPGAGLEFLLTAKAPRLAEHYDVRVHLCPLHPLKDRLHVSLGAVEVYSLSTSKSPALKLTQG